MSDSVLAETIAALEARERSLVFTVFGHDDAWRLGGITMRLATERSLGIAVDIRRGDQQVFKGTTAGSNAGNDAWVARKIRTARLLDSSTLLLRLKTESSGRALDWLDPVEYAVHGGCVPLRVAGGAIVGLLTISGLTDVDDHELALETIEEFLGTR